MSEQIAVLFEVSAYLLCLSVVMNTSRTQSASVKKRSILAKTTNLSQMLIKEKLNRSCGHRYLFRCNLKSRTLIICTRCNLSFLGFVLKFRLND